MLIGTYPIKIVLAGGMVGFIIITTAFKNIKGKLSKKDMLCNIKININSNSVYTKAILDTGNFLKEPITKIPVAVVEKDVLKGVIPEKILNNLSNIIEGKEIDLNSNYPNDYIKSLKAAKNGIVRVKGNEIYGEKPGKVVITVTTKSNMKLSCVVTVEKADVSLSKKTLTLIAKNTYKLTVIKKISSDSISKWISSNKKVVTVDRNGKITAKSKGTCYITVIMKSGASAKVKVTVQKKVVIKKLKLNVKTVVLRGIGKNYQLKVKKIPVKANEKIIYKTSRSKIATVSNQGKITAKKRGTCVITVIGGKKKARVKITVK